MIAPRSKLLAWVALLVLPLAAIAGPAPSLRPLAGAAIALAFLVAGADAWLARHALRRVTVALPELVRLSRGRKGSVALRITHYGLPERRLRLGLAFPKEIESADEDTWTRLPAGTPVCGISCGCVPPKRGSYILDACYLETPSRLG